MKALAAAALAATIGLFFGGEALAANHASAAGGSAGMMGSGVMSPGLMMPSMDSTRGKQLFAAKGCVVCHSVNGTGGEDAPPLDASTMSLPMNPFDFAASMWRGAEAMVILQREELGGQIELTGQELADIIAFVHDEAQQKTFSRDDIPPMMRDMMGHMQGLDEHEEGVKHEGEDKME